MLVALAGVRAGSVGSSPGVIGSGSWRAGHPGPIGVEGGRAAFEVPRPGARWQTLAIVSALARGPTPGGK